MRDILEWTDCGKGMESRSDFIDAVRDFGEAVNLTIHLRLKNRPETEVVRTVSALYDDPDATRRAMNALVMDKA